MNLKIFIFVLFCCFSLQADFNKALDNIRAGKSNGMLLFNSPEDGRLYKEVLKDYKWSDKIEFVRVSPNEKITNPWSNRIGPAGDVLNNLGNVPSGTMTFIDGNGNHFKDLIWTNLFFNYDSATVKEVEDYIISGTYKDFSFQSHLLAMNPSLKKHYDRVGDGKLLINKYESLKFDRFLIDMKGEQVALASIKKSIILVANPSSCPIYERILKEIRFYLPKIKIYVESGPEGLPFKEKYKIEEVFNISEYKEGYPLMYYVSDEGVVISAEGYTPILAFAGVCGLTPSQEWYRDNIDIPLAEYFKK